MAEYILKVPPVQLGEGPIRANTCTSEGRVLQAAAAYCRSKAPPFPVQGGGTQVRCLDWYQ